MKNAFDVIRNVSASYATLSYFCYFSSENADGKIHFRSAPLWSSFQKNHFYLIKTSLLIILRACRGIEEGGVDNLLH